MTTNIVREKISKGRAPTLSGNKVCVGKSEVHYDARKYEHADARNSSVTRVYESAPRLNDSTLTSHPQPLQTPNRDNTHLIDQLKHNPYAIPSFQNGL